MKNTIKLVLTSAIMATSGFSASGDVLLEGETQFEASNAVELLDGGIIDRNSILNIKGQTIKLAKGTVLDVYGSITGSGQIITIEEGDDIIKDSIKVEDWVVADPAPEGEVVPVDPDLVEGDLASMVIKDASLIQNVALEKGVPLKTVKIAKMATEAPLEGGDIYENLVDLTPVKTIVRLHGSTYKEASEYESQAIASSIEGIYDEEFIEGVTHHVIDDESRGSIDPSILFGKSITVDQNGSGLANYASGLKDGNHLIYVANSSGKPIECMGQTDEPTEIGVALANAGDAIEDLKPANLVALRNVKFSGDNSGFTNGEFKVGTEIVPANVMIANSKAIFPVETTVEVGSALFLNTTEEATLAKDITVNSRTKVLKADHSVVLDNKTGNLIIKGKLLLTKGAKMTLGNEPEEVIADHTYEYPQVMKWPVGTFNNEMMTSDGNDGWNAGTIHDTVFSYTKDEDGSYVRTHQHRWIIDGMSQPGIERVTTKTIESDLSDVTKIIDYLGNGNYTCDKCTKSSKSVSLSLSAGPSLHFDISFEGSRLYGVYSTINMNELEKVLTDEDDIAEAPSVSADAASK